MDSQALKLLTYNKHLEKWFYTVDITAFPSAGIGDEPLIVVVDETSLCNACGHLVYDHEHIQLGSTSGVKGSINICHSHNCHCPRPEFLRYKSTGTPLHTVDKIDGDWDL
jgi:hypothetical protein